MRWLSLWSYSCLDQKWWPFPDTYLIFFFYVPQNCSWKKKKIKMHIYVIYVRKPPVQNHCFGVFCKWLFNVCHSKKWFQRLLGSILFHATFSLHRKIKRCGSACASPCLVAGCCSSSKWLTGSFASRMKEVSFYPKSTVIPIHNVQLSALLVCLSFPQKLSSW